MACPALARDLIEQLRVAGLGDLAGCIGLRGGRIIGVGLQAMALEIARAVELSRRQLALEAILLALVEHLPLGVETLLRLLYYVLLALGGGLGAHDRRIQVGAEDLVNE